MSAGTLIPAERVDQLIFVVRGQRVILDSDLARLYAVAQKILQGQSSVMPVA
jgi:hypothetical protein